MYARVLNVPFRSISLVLNYYYTMQFRYILRHRNDTNYQLHHICISLILLLRTCRCAWMNDGWKQLQWCSTEGMRIRLQHCQPCIRLEVNRLFPTKLANDSRYSEGPVFHLDDGRKGENCANRTNGFTRIAAISTNLGFRVI